VGNASPIVVVGGSGMGPWSWQRVTPLLDAAGVRALTPVLRATGEDTTPAAEVGLVYWIDDVTSLFAGRDLGDVTPGGALRRRLRRRGRAGA
jgi:hypothetical protein